MNYTRPDLADQGHDDSPKDWLASALIFTRALHFLLKENEGIIVDVMGDTLNLVDFKKAIVYRKNNQVRITECVEDLPDGQLVWMNEEELPKEDPLNT